MNEINISCPNCDHAFALTESLAAPLLAKKRKEFDQAIVDKDREVAEREAALRSERALLEKARTSLEETVAAKVETERKSIAEREAAKAKARASADLDAKSKELAELQSLLKERNEKLAEAQKAQAEVLRKERELEDAKRELELKVEQRVQASIADVREKVRAEATEEAKLSVRQKEEQIASMTRQIEELKRKAEQGSQQLQGEALELEFEDMLRSKFPRDAIEPVPKGELGGDLIQRVFGASDKPAGIILWETKRTKAFGEPWIAKLRDDQRRAGADIAVIVSSALPKGVQTFDYVDGVWVTDFRCALPIALALRKALIEVAAARQAGEGQQSKMELVYQYLTGARFKQRIEAIVEKFTEMQADLDRERRTMTKLWAKREQQIRGVVEATAGLYGDLQGIAGKAIQEIEALELPALEDQSEDNDIAA